ncbi:MAG TPA: anti-sigma factor [Rhodothermales bacterium]|nr:anti-sigma factor [Rhodothermales bacterium]
MNRSLRQTLALCFGLLLFAAPLQADPTVTPDEVCLIADPDPPEYYKIDLVPTGRVPGTRLLRGVGAVTFAPSPFGIAISPEGSYVYKLDVSVTDLKPPPNGVYAVWVSTHDLTAIKSLGVLDENMQIKGTVDWNKFLVIITLEPAAESIGDSWTGPVVFRGLSRSGMMHTMAGHGPFQQEPCATYGYN